MTAWYLLWFGKTAGSDSKFKQYSEDLHYIHQQMARTEMAGLKKFMTSRGYGFKAIRIKQVIPVSDLNVLSYFRSDQSVPDLLLDLR